MHHFCDIPSLSHFMPTTFLLSKKVINQQQTVLFHYHYYS